MLSECVRLIQAEKGIFILKKVKQKISDHSCLNLSKWLPETFLLLVRPNHQLQLLCVYLTTHSDIPIWHQSIQVVRLLVAYSARYWTANHTTNKHWYTETFFLGWTSTCLLLIILASLGGNQTRNPWVGSQVFYHWAKWSNVDFCARKLSNQAEAFPKALFSPLSLLKYCRNYSWVPVTLFLANFNDNLKFVLISMQILPNEAFLWEFMLYYNAHHLGQSQHWMAGNAHNFLEPLM